MSIQNALAGLAVRDLPTAIPWYESLLQQSPQQPMPEVAEWQFPRGGCIQVFADDNRAGKSSVTLSVPDLDAELKRLSPLGVKAFHLHYSAKVNTAIIEDPDGNQIVLAQPLTASLAQ